MTSTESDAPPQMPPEIERMNGALRRGDHASLRSLAKRFATPDDHAVRDAARAGLERFARDPWIDAVFAVTALLMIALAAHYLGRPH